MADHRASRGRLVELVGHIYDAALDDRLWAGTADRIAGTLGATSTVMKLHGSDDRVHLLESTANLVIPDQRQDWAGYWHSRDLWVQRSVSYGLSRIVTSDDLVTADERRKSGFYQEWLPQLDIHHMIGAVFAAEGGAIGVLGVHRPAGVSGFSQADRNATAFLLPHLERAMRLGQRMAQASFAREAALESLDALDTGVVIADRRGGIRHMSTVAEAIIARCPGLLVQTGRLCAGESAMQSRLLASLGGAVMLGAGEMASLPAPLRFDRADAPPCTVAFAPLRARWSALAWAEPLALVLLRDPAYPPYRIDQLRTLFGLTRMEALTAAELLRGRTLEEIGHALSIGLGTVRTHLKQILLKTETNRQAEAVAVLARSVAAMPPA